MESDNSQGPVPRIPEPALSSGVAAPKRARSTWSVPEVVARGFAAASIGLRARVLGRLVSSVGTLGLAVVSGGVFFKFLPQARSVSVDDVARVTTGQVLELARYVQQSNPAAITQVMGLLSRDVSTMSALGASVAAIIMRYLAERSPRVD